LHDRLTEARRHTRKVIREGNRKSKSRSAYQAALDAAMTEIGAITRSKPSPVSHFQATIESSNVPPRTGVALVHG
jgi:hypothetical protein